MKTRWIPISESFPAIATRCLVTDGNIIIIATYLEDHDNKKTWIFSGLTDTNDKTFNVQCWMDLPKLPKKIIIYNEMKEEDNDKEKEII